MLDVDIEVAGAIALGVVAATLILSAWYGRALGLVSLAVLLTVVCGVAAIVDTPFKGGVGDRSYLPVSARELQPEYRLAIGNLRLDLRAVPLPAGTTTVTASVAIGELHVIVPTDVSVDVHAEAGVGQVDVFGIASSGFSAERNDSVRVVEHPHLAPRATNRRGARDGGTERFMTRHRLDVFSLCAGVLFMALAIGFLLDGLDVWNAHASWVVPVLLIVFGLAGVLTTVGRHTRRTDSLPDQEPGA